MWLHVNNCCKGAVACLYQEGGISGIMFCDQTGGPITWWAHKRGFTVWEEPPEYVFVIGYVIP